MDNLFDGLVMKRQLHAGLLIVALFNPAVTSCGAAEPAGKKSALPAPFTAAEFQTHAAFLSSDELAGRAPGSDGARKASTYIIERLTEYGYKPLAESGSWFQEFPLRIASGKTTGRNILAVMPGRGNLKEQAVIVTAHYDHLEVALDGEDGDDRIFNGADDNASGVAALLIVAKGLAAARDSLPESHRTLIVASFDAEEQGLIGSQNYVKKPLWPLDQTAAVINFDSMGRLRMGKVFASDAETNPFLAQVARDAARTRGIIADTNVGGHGRSDHAVFIERGIPAMHFFTGAHSDYHQVTDEADRLNFDGGATIAWIGFEVAKQAMLRPGRIEFRKLNPKYDVTLALNLIKAFGIVPVVNAQEGRYPQILYVLPNSLAAKHGFKSGDQITAVNGLQIKRVEDALNVFQQLSFDDGMRFSILRAGEKAVANIPATVFEELSGPKSKRLADGRYQVQFHYQAAPQVKAVYLAGEFNGWKPMGHRMDGPGPGGLFTTQLELKPGVYEYKFVVEGTDWKADPKNLYQIGKYNNSVLWVGPRDQ